MTTVADIPFAELAIAQAPSAPWSWKRSLYRDDAPGTVLDNQPWARNWPAYLHAISDLRDPSARQYIGNAMSERVPGEGGFLVPENLRSQVLEYMTGAIVRPQAMALPMDSLRLPIPLLDNPSQYNGAQALGGLTFAVTEEGSAISASNPAFGQLVLEARKVAAYLEGVPNELISDSPALAIFLSQVIARGYSWYEDDLFVYNGTGIGQPQSLANAACAVTIARAFADYVTLADLVAMYKSLHPASKQKATLPGRPSATWLLSSTVMDQLLELFLAPNPGSDPSTPGAAAGTGVIATPSEWFSAGDDQTGATLLGMPAIVTDHQPALGTTGDVILADLSNYVIGDRAVMTIERSQAGSGFVTDTSNYRITARLDGRYWIQTSSTNEADQTVSPVVVLGPTS